MAWRRETWDKIKGPWDVLVIGGGITGAGVFRLAAGAGLKVLLVDQGDFAWGTSSRSGKLVHGGLRYLKQGQLNVTRHSVRERERLLREAPGLVNPLEFILPMYAGQGALRAAYGLGLGIYDLLAGRKTRRRFSREEFVALEPSAARADLTGGLGYQDAWTDDARLVLRLIMEAADDGGHALNYAPAEGLLLNSSGRVAGAVIRDRATGEAAEAAARVVINATGAWTDRLRGHLGRSPVIRPLRGSHLVFPRTRLPLARALSFQHPRDKRPLYVIPWEGVTLAGTTDLDSTDGLDGEPSITAGETEYLLAAVQFAFPSLGLGEEDIMSTFTGVRPVVGGGRKDPSKESRDMLVREECGLITVTGGKLTTFRLLALKALSMAVGKLPVKMPDLEKKRVYRESPACPGLEDRHLEYRLAGRYGRMARRLLEEASSEEMQEIQGSVYLRAELKHAARHEMAVHLDDLLIRRLRLGLVLPGGGAGSLESFRDIVCPAMGWDEERWRSECDRYIAVWHKACRPGGKGEDRR